LLDEHAPFDQAPESQSELFPGLLEENSTDDPLPQVDSPPLEEAQKVPQEATHRQFARFEVLLSQHSRQLDEIQSSLTQLRQFIMSGSDEESQKRTVKRRKRQRENRTHSNTGASRGVVKYEAVSDPTELHIGDRVESRFQGEAVYYPGMCGCDMFSIPFCRMQIVKYYSSMFLFHVQV